MPPAFLFSEYITYTHLWRAINHVHVVFVVTVWEHMTWEHGSTSHSGLFQLRPCLGPAHPHWQAAPRHQTRHNLGEKDPHLSISLSRRPSPLDWAAGGHFPPWLLHSPQSPGRESEKGDGMLRWKTTLMVSCILPLLPPACPGRTVIKTRPFWATRSTEPYDCAVWAYRTNMKEEGLEGAWGGIMKHPGCVHLRLKQAQPKICHFP